MIPITLIKVILTLILPVGATITYKTNTTKHKYLSTADILHKGFGLSMQQFTGGEIPFP